MPELPEVENVCRNLNALVVGQQIENVVVRLPRLIRHPNDPCQFVDALRGRTIQDVSRRGKHLILRIPPYTLVSHLRMEGQYTFAKNTTEPEMPHTHVVFTFTDGSQLRYRDVRQFGTMDLVEDGQPYPNGLVSLGPEPFDPLLTQSVLYRKLHERKAPIKAVLLDQTFLAGLGNIYVDEALFGAGIHPMTSANRVSRKGAERLLDSIRDVLSRAIEAGGSSIKTFVNGYGRHGGFQIQLAVYGRAGAPCHACGSEIQKTRVAGRGTHFCPRCQRLSRRTGNRLSMAKRRGEDTV